MTKRDGCLDAHARLDARARTGNTRMFLPRSLHSHPPSSSRPRSRPSPQTQPPPAAARDSTAELPPSEDPAILCVLAFSDYEIWSNPTLRDPNHDGCMSSFFPREPKPKIKKIKKKLQLSHLGHLCIPPPSFSRQMWFHGQKLPSSSPSAHTRPTFLTST